MPVKIEGRSIQVGGWLTVTNAMVAESMAATGLYDWLAFDAEHSLINEETIHGFVLACERRQVLPYVRLPGQDPLFARRMLDLGVAGLIVPVVEDVEAFEKFCAHLFYPPKGRRGVCIYRMNEWGKNFDTYLTQNTPTIIPQIETVKGAAVAEKVAQLPYVSSLFVGPYDLSASLGQPGIFSGAVFENEIQKIKLAAKNQKKGLMIHIVEPDENRFIERVREGFDTIIYGTDMILLRAPIQSLQKRLER